MSARRALLWVVAAAGVGLAMRALADYATDRHAASNLLLDVVNWAAVWCVVPVLAGRDAGRALIAGALGLLTGAIEVIAFYGNVLSGSPVKLVWLIGGGLAAGLLATVAQRLRTRPPSSLLLPGLFVVEPALSFLALRALARHPWSSWGASALAEVLVGVAAGVAVSRRSPAVIPRGSGGRAPSRRAG